MWGGWGHLSPVPELWGWSVCAPPIPLLLPLRIPCSLVVTKLISNSCSPSPPLSRPDSEKLKREPQSIGCCRAWPMLLGLGEWKGTKYRGTYAQFFLRCGLDCFSSIYLFQILSPLPTSQGLCCYSERWDDSDLHCNHCAPSPQRGNLTKATKGRQGNAKLIVRNEVFECLTLLKIWKMGFSPPVNILLTDRSKAVLFCGSFMVFSVLLLLCLCARLFICALWSPAGKGLTSWLSFVVS